MNSRVSNSPTAVFNAMEVFKNDFRCITMDQRNATGGETSGPLAIDDPWGAFADDQLAVMDHLGIPEFFYMGYCIGGCFAGKLLERAPARIVAAVFCQTVGHRPEEPDVMYRSGKDVWAPELLAKAAGTDHGAVETICTTCTDASRLRLQRTTRFRQELSDTDVGLAGRHSGPPAPDRST